MLWYDMHWKNWQLGLSMSNDHHLRFDCIQLIRNFFVARQYRDVLTPPIVENPGMEVHLHPLSIYSEYKKEKVQGYLHTSPEFLMKELLRASFEKIFTINYCFRDEPSSSTHRRQFIMLEWYRTGSRLQDFIDETINLVDTVSSELDKLGYTIDGSIKDASFTVKTVQEVFLEHLNLAILDHLEADSLKDWIKKHRPQLPANDHEDWPYEDYFFLLFLNEIEPKLSQYPKLILKDYPAPLAALSRIKEGDPRACLRFELFKWR
jgi:elongation factor P--(R)-beta-lysine ligase